MQAEKYCNEKKNAFIDNFQRYGTRVANIGTVQGLYFSTIVIPQMTTPSSHI